MEYLFRLSTYQPVRLVCVTASTRLFSHHQITTISNTTNNNPTTVDQTIIAHLFSDYFFPLGLILILILPS